MEPKIVCRIRRVRISASKMVLKETPKQLSAASGVTKPLICNSLLRRIEPAKADTNFHELKI
jgi:hypothetical protein